MLPLQEAITAALSNNKEVQIAGMDEKIAISKFEEIRAVYLPQAGFSYSAMNTDNPLNAFGFKLQQKTIQQKDFHPVLLNHPGGTTDFMSRIEVKQPLVNMDMHYQRKAAEQQIGITSLKRNDPKSTSASRCGKLICSCSWLTTSFRCLKMPWKRQEVCSVLPITGINRGYCKNRTC